MRRISKVMLILALVILLILMFFNVVQNQDVISLPFYFMSMYQYPLIGPYMGTLILWTSIIFLILIIVSIVIILFFPKKEEQVQFSKEKGKLVIQKKAIEHFIFSIVKQESFIDVSSVKIKMTRKKLKVTIIGKMRLTDAVPQKYEELTCTIKENLETLFGLTNQINTQVILKDTANKKNDGNKPRVI